MASKKITKPVRVRFRTSDGESVSFKAHRDFTKNVRVSFLAKRKKRR